MAAAESGADAWALTGSGPNALSGLCAESVCLPGDTATVQESHLAALHMVCRAVEQVVADAPPEPDDADPDAGRRAPGDRPRVVS